MTGYPTPLLTPTPPRPQASEHDPCEPQKVRWNATVEETGLQPLVFTLTPCTPKETSSESLRQEVSYKSEASLYQGNGK